MVNFVACLALVTAGATTPPTGEPVCTADEPEGLFLLQSGPSLRTPAVRPPRGLSLLQEAPEPGVSKAPGAGVGARVDTRGDGAVTIVMPPKGIALVTSRKNVTSKEDEKQLGNTDGKSGKQQDDPEDHADSNNDDATPNEDHEDTGISTQHLSIKDRDEDTSTQVSDATPGNMTHVPEIFDIPSDECEKPCVNGICHDGECFCRYPFVGLQCDILAISEISKLLAAAMLTGVALFTALCVVVVYRANQKATVAAPVQEPHMADEEWLPPPPDDGGVRIIRA